MVTGDCPHGTDAFEKPATFDPLDAQCAVSKVRQEQKSYACLAGPIQSDRRKHRDGNGNTYGVAYDQLAAPEIPAKTLFVGNCIAFILPNMMDPPGPPSTFFHDI